MCKLLFAEKCIPTTKKPHQENISIMFSVGKNYNKKKNPHSKCLLGGTVGQLALLPHSKRLGSFHVLPVPVWVVDSLQVLWLLPRIQRHVCMLD